MGVTGDAASDPADMLRGAMNPPQAPANIARYIMPTRPAKGVLHRLPPDLAFLGPCVSEMRKLRVGYRPSVDPSEHPEAARDEEIDRFLTRDFRILGGGVRGAVVAGSAEEFADRVRGLAFALVRWLRTRAKRHADPEVAQLSVVAGYMMDPYALYKSPRKRARRRGGKRAGGTARRKSKTR